jgi:hypothetical protein
MFEPTGPSEGAADRGVSGGGVGAEAESGGDVGVTYADGSPGETRDPGRRVQSDESSVQRASSGTVRACETAGEGESRRGARAPVATTDEVAAALTSRVVSAVEALLSVPMHVMEREADRGKRRALRAAGREAQLARMGLYLQAARAASLVGELESRRDGDEGGRSGKAVRWSLRASPQPCRLPSARGKMRRLVAPVEASAFCIPRSVAASTRADAATGGACGTAGCEPREQGITADSDVRPERRGWPTSVAPGSADPHGLRLDDDRVMRSRRSPTFSLMAHERASDEELLARPIAALNVPERTEPLPPPEPTLEGAPRVTSIEQLLTREWLTRVRAWERRCRRCMTLARRGDWRAARRMRPPDLWVSASESMRPEVAAWVWDLRPLARGLPAVPVAVSGTAGVEPTGDILLDAVRGVDASFTDRGILDEVCYGVSDDVQGPRGSFLCAPHSGALKQMAIADAKLRALVAEHWGEEHASLPYWPMRCDPYSIVDESVRAGKPKFRLTNDHSWPPPGAVAGDGTCVGPWGEHVPSLNEAMDRGNWPAARMVRVREVAEAAAILQTSGAPVRVSVLDCRAYYKRFGRQLSELWRNGAVSGDGYIVDGRCCFGSAADAAKCTRFSNVIVHEIRAELREVDEMYPPRDPRVLSWLEQRREEGRAAGASEQEIELRWACLSVASMYIDDQSTVSLDDALWGIDGAPLMHDGVHATRADAHFEAVRRVLARFGHESEPSKEQSPREVVDLLGVELNLREGRMRLSERKRDSYWKQVDAALRGRTCERDAFESLLGKLTFAASCYPRGRQWLHAPWRAMRARFRTADGRIVMTKAVRAGLSEWAGALQDVAHPGVPLAARRVMPPSTSVEALSVYADAALDCPRAGFGAWAVRGSELLYVQGEWSSVERRLLICDLELAASTFGLVALQPKLGKSSVYSFTDNTVAMAAMKSTTPTTAAMQAITSARVEWLLEHRVAEAAERVTSKANLWADMLSRDDVAGVEAQAMALGLVPRRVAVPRAWRDLVARAAAEHGERELPALTASGAVMAPSPPSPPRCRAGGVAGRRAGDGGDAVERTGALPRGGDSGRRGGGEHDRSALVDQVLPPRQESPPVLPADSLLPA